MSLFDDIRKNIEELRKQYNIGKNTVSAVRDYVAETYQPTSPTRRVDDALVRGGHLLPRNIRNDPEKIRQYYSSPEARAAHAKSPDGRALDLTRDTLVSVGLGLQKVGRDFAEGVKRGEEIEAEILPKWLPQQARAKSGFNAGIARFAGEDIIGSYGRTSERLGRDPVGVVESISKLPEQVKREGVLDTLASPGAEDLFNAMDVVPGIGLVAGGIADVSKLRKLGKLDDAAKLGKFPKILKRIKTLLPSKGGLDAAEEISTKLGPQELLAAKGKDTENLAKILSDVARKPEELASTSKKLSTVSSYGDIIPPEDADKVIRAVDKKVNLLDWLRTPDRVLRKIGLGEEADLLRKKYDDYLQELPVEIDKITGWFNRVKDIPDSEKRIFKYLDGQKIELSDVELNVAGEIKTYLSEWADKLKLPEDKRIANYITHIFEKDFIQKEFDPELAKIIADKIPGSVYDPFLQKRLGKLGFKENVWEALDAYVKRGTRKYNMDQALEVISRKSDALDLESWNYVKKLIDKVNLRPADVDNYMDNLIKQSPLGYKFGVRPTALLSRRFRQMTYRGTLGGNIGSALKNLTQGVNTYAKLGEKYTGIGYAKITKELLTGGDELARTGVLADNFIQDRTLSSSKKLLEKTDKALFTFFDFAEKVNRGAAYFGAKAKALAKGASEGDAIKAGVKLAADTQFRFGSIDTPVALQGDLVKFITQFQSYNIKQAEFLGEMLKNKEFTGLLRWAAATYGVTATIGKVFNYDFGDAIPFKGAVTGESKIGNTPTTQLAGAITKAALKVPDRYGNVPEGNLAQRLIGSRDIKRSLPAFIPGGVQIKKTVQGVDAITQGYSETASGRVRFPVDKTPANTLTGTLLGQYSVPEAREYFDKDLKPLGTSQSEEFKSLTPEEAREFYEGVINRRLILADRTDELLGNNVDSALEQSMTESGNIGKDAMKILSKTKEKGLVSSEFVNAQVRQQVEKYSLKDGGYGVTAINFLNDTLELKLITRTEYDNIVKHLDLNEDAKEKIK